MATDPIMEVLIQNTRQDGRFFINFSLSIGDGDRIRIVEELTCAGLACVTSLWNGTVDELVERIEARKPATRPKLSVFVLPKTEISSYSESVEEIDPPPKTTDATFLLPNTVIDEIIGSFAETTAA